MHDSRLPALPPESRRPVASAFLAVVAMVVVGLAVAVAVLALAAALGIEAGSRDRQVLLALDVLASVGVTLGALVWFARRREGWSAQDLGLRRTPGFWWSVGAAVLCYLGYLAVAAAWVSVVRAPSRGHDLLKAVGERPPLFVTIAVVAGACVGAPILEELLFRGFLYRALIGWRGHVAAAFASSAVFGALHAPSVPLKLLPVLGALGFALCVLYRRTGSILPGMGLHAFQNSLAMGVALGMRGWTLALMGGSWAAIWLLTTPWRRAEALPRPSASLDERRDRNAALPDWSRVPFLGDPDESRL